MKQITASFAAVLLAAAPLHAQSADDAERGADLVEEGAKLLLRGLLGEIEPTLREFENFAQEVGPAMKLLADEMGPALAEVMGQIDDIRNYEGPEMLPNGDIIIRRRPEAPPFAPPPAPRIDL